MADEFIELAFEGVDRASDPDFIYHRKRKEKRERKLAAEAAQQPKGDTSQRPRRASDRGYSPSDSFDPTPQDRAIYPDARNPNYSSRGSDRYGSSEVTSRGRAPGYDKDLEDYRREKGRRPDFRSRSSHQGNQSIYPDEYEDVDDMRSRRARSQKGRSSRTKSRNDSPKSGIGKAGEYFSDTKAGLGATALGTLAGGYIAYRTGRDKEKSGEESDPMLLALLGAVAGGVGANVIERYVENGKDDGRVRDKWGEEVGTSRKQMKEKMRNMTRGDRRDEDRRGRRRDDYDDDY